MKTDAPLNLPRAIDRFIRGYVARANRIVLLRQIGTAAAFGLFWLLLACLVDRLWPLSAFVRWIVLLVGAVLLLLFLLDALLQLFNRRIDYSIAAIAIERRVPDLAQRLETVVTQLSASAELQASRALTLELLTQVEDRISEHRAEKLLKSNEAAGPWVVFATLVVLAISLSFSQWMDLKRIAHRVVWPAAPIAPATTARLAVTPGTSRVAAGRAVTIAVQAEGLASQEFPRIHLTSDNESYLAAAMSPLEGKFVYVIPAADRDFAYYITAGDARSAMYSIHVMQPPAVKQFDITYTYPAYMKRSPLHVTNSDGLIEAPVGTTATLAVLATEPLNDARLISSTQQTIPLIPPGSSTAANSRQVALVINANQTYQLKMTSRDGVAATFPGQLTVRALADRPPLSRLIQPDTDLRLHPREILPITFQALDDYGIASLTIEPQINARQVQAIAVPLNGDPRRQEATFDLDLAAFKLNIGDVLSIQIVAVDGSGQRAASEMRHILVSPRSIDFNTHQRLSSLKESANLAKSINDSLVAAIAALEEANRAGSATRPAERAGVGRAFQNLGNVLESSSLLRQELLSALSHASSAQQGTLLAGLLDSDVHVAALCELAMSRLNATSRSLDPSLNTVKSASSSAGASASQLSILSRAEQASALLADHANLAATKSLKPASDASAAQRLAQTIDRAQKDFAGGLAELNLRSDAADLNSQLQKRIDEAKAFQDKAQPMDFVELARQWTLNLGKPELSDIALPRRLEAAAEAESTSPEPDLIRARDLELCSRAARMMEAGLTQDARDPAAAMQRQQFAPALAALEQEHRLHLHSTDTRPADVVKTITAAAMDARVKMRRWAAEPDLLLTAAQAIERQRQSMVLEANAEMIARNYDRAGQLDQKVTNSSTSQPAMRAVQRVDQVSDRQRDLAQQTAQATADRAQVLSERQRQVAEAIERAQQQNRSDLSRPAPDGAELNSRQQALMLIQRGQEELTNLPQKMDAARRVAESLRSAKDRLAQAQSVLAAAGPETKDAAKRAVDQAIKALADATGQWQVASDSLKLQGAQSLAAELLQAGPDTAAVSQSIRELLVPTLANLAKAGSQGDSGAMDESAESARRALAKIQDQLRTAQADLVERDPLVAAHWFAQAASSALAQKPPDFPAAMRHQAAASAALSRAWVGAVRQAAASRLAIASNPVTPTPVASKWGNLSVPQSSASASPVRDADAPEYEEAIKAYFEALAKAGEAAQ